MIRKPSVAGSFYPKDKDTLTCQIKEFLKNAKKHQIPGKIRALIVPHAGYSYSGIVSASGFRLLKNEKKIIILGPCHQFYFNEFFASGYDYWETPLGRIKVIKNNLPVLKNAHEFEHSIEIQLPFLQVVLKNFEILPISINGSGYKGLIDRIVDMVDDETVFIASSDLSHYHLLKDAVKIDSVANKSIPNLDMEKAQKIEACGKEAILAVMELAKRFGWKGKLLDYRTSGEITGEDKVVGYGCYVFFGD